MFDDILMKLKKRKIEKDQNKKEKKDVLYKAEEKKAVNDNKAEKKLIQKNKNNKEPSLIISTQTVLPSVNERLLWKKEEYAKKKHISIGQIIESKSLKADGYVIGYIKHITQESLRENVLLADETDEILCAVHPEVFDKYVLEKDTVLVLSMPSVWRLAHTKTLSVLNITPKNIISVSHASYKGVK